ncbi:hypothetical protein D3C71_1722520 [compost metagenome]
MQQIGRSGLAQPTTEQAFRRRVPGDDIPGDIQQVARHRHLVNALQHRAVVGFVRLFLFGVCDSRQGKQVVALGMP